MRAFAVVHREFPEARLVIAGRRDEDDVEREVRHLISSLAIEDAVRVVIDAPIEALEQEVRDCDVAIALRWPSAGETSSIVAVALGAGKPVIVSDLPQYRHLDPTYCWAVPTGSDGEQIGLVALMRKVVSDPAASAVAGRLACALVEGTGSLAHTRDRYIEVIEQSARDVDFHHPTDDGQRTDGCQLGVNVIGDWWATTGLAEAARRSATALVDAKARVSVVSFPIASVPREENRAPDWLWSLPHGRKHPVDVWYLNINELWVVPDDVLRPPGTDQYLIASMVLGAPPDRYGFCEPGRSCRRDLGREPLRSRHVPWPHGQARSRHAVRYRAKSFTVGDAVRFGTPRGCVRVPLQLRRELVLRS